MKPKHVIRNTAMGLVGLTLFGSGVVLGYWLGYKAPATAQATANPVIAVADDTSSLPPVSVAGRYMDDGVSFLNKNDRSAAIASFRKAVMQYDAVLQTEPDNLYAKSYLGLTYFYLGDTTKAISTEKAVLAQDPNYLWAIFNLAWITETAGKKADAAVLYQKYVDLGPTEVTDTLKYAEQPELIPRQIEAAKKALANLQGGGQK